MFDVFRNAWKIADLRKKILYTLLILLIFRIGSAIPVPFLDTSAVATMIGTQGSLLSYLDMLTGGAFSQATLFALSISPYITASIVIQLLTIAIPALERLSKEGEDGRKKLNKITRYSTILLALIQALAYYLMLRRTTLADNTSSVKYVTGFSGFLAGTTIVLAFMAGATLVMWLGEQIDNRGIGNGISIILFAGIVSRGPSLVSTVWSYLQLGAEGAYQNFFYIPFFLVLFLAVIVGIVIMNNAERRIPVQYAKRVVGRKMYGGQSSHIPVKVSMSGVMPIIFASALLSIPATIGGFVNVEAGSFWYGFFQLFSSTSWLYAILYFLLIIGFNYFYVALQYNPIEMANNLQKNNGTIPGIRPGRPTSEFIQKVISKITLVGALFLGVIAVLPIVLSAISQINISWGGTSIIIVVGVALDTTRQLESQMMMRHYKGFLE